MSGMNVTVYNASSEKTIRAKICPLNEDSGNFRTLLPKTKEEWSILCGVMKMHIRSESDEELWKGIVPVRVKKHISYDSDTNTVTYDGTLVPASNTEFDPASFSASSGIGYKTVVLLIVIVIALFSSVIYYTSLRKK